MTAALVPADARYVDEDARAERSVLALERIAMAMEQLVLELADRLPIVSPVIQQGIVAADGYTEPLPYQSLPPDQLAPFPMGAVPVAPPVPVHVSQTLAAAAPMQQWSCPIHHTTKVVPAGVSKRTGKAYSTFLACGEAGCNEKPPR